MSIAKNILKMLEGHDPHVGGEHDTDAYGNDDSEKSDNMQTSTENGHYHNYKIDSNGDGTTTSTSTGDKHTHKIKNSEVLEIHEHTHSIN